MPYPDLSSHFFRETYSFHIPCLPFIKFCLPSCGYSGKFLLYKLPPPSLDMDTLVGPLHTYLSPTLYSQAALLFSYPLVQFRKSKIVSFFKDFSDVRCLKSVNTIILWSDDPYAIMKYLNCTNYALSEFLFRLAGDIHLNPGPVKNVKKLSFCQWNQNGINERDSGLKFH